jgi:hypothetical protein
MSGAQELVAVHAQLGTPLVAVPQLALVVTSVVHALGGHGPRWPIPYTLVCLILVGVQINMGYQLEFAVHIPLGVALLGASVWLAAWAGNRLARLGPPPQGRPAGPPPTWQRRGGEENRP